MKFGILGKGGSGKDTVADMLREEGFKVVAFSDGLYDVCRDFYGMKEKDRALLQDVGAAMRTVDPAVFIKRAIRSLDGAENQCISDVRAVNEYETLKDLGFKLIRIETDLATRIKRIEKRDGIVCDDAYIERLERAPIEVYLDGYPVDYLLDNNGTIQELREQVIQMLENER